MKENLKSKETWKRGLFMLLFAVIYGIAEVLLVAVALFQFLSRLFTGEVNRRLLNFGQSLATYIYQIALFVTFRSDDRPYPFDAWPKGAPAGPPKPRRRRTKTASGAPEAAPEGGEEGA